MHITSQRKGETGKSKSRKKKKNKYTNKQDGWLLTQKSGKSASDLRLLADVFFFVLYIFVAEMTYNKKVKAQT